MGVLPHHHAANEEVTRLRAAAATMRRYAGTLQYHPETGLANPPGPEFWEAMRALRESLARVSDWTPALDAEERALAPTVDAHVLAGIHGGHARVAALAEQLRASLDVLEAVIVDPERARLDAPYGLGTPRRAHPGAQATWVAERADSLARELGYVTLVKLNLPRRAEAPPGSPNGSAQGE